MISYKRIDIHTLAATVSGGPASSLAPMPVRRGCLLRLEDADGAYGWGEAWCNFPPRGAESRAHLLEDVIAPLLLERGFADWQEVRPTLERALIRMMLHTGEAGAFAQCLAAVDMACADLAARRAGLPLCDFLGRHSATVEVYASTPSAADRAAQCADLVHQGHRAVKLKVGCARDVDRATLAACRAAVGANVALMVDANQAWEVDEAIERASELAAFDLDFVEEPLRADAPLAAWQRLAGAIGTAVAAGENIVGADEFEAKLKARAIRVAQPDLCKWGGVSGGVAVGRMALALGAIFNPHYMGCAIGLAATLHVKAAIGGPGRVELDANDNPLRTELAPLDLSVREGRVLVPTGRGIGIEPDNAALRRMSTASCSIGG